MHHLQYTQQFSEVSELPFIPLIRQDENPERFFSIISSDKVSQTLYLDNMKLHEVAC